MLISVLASFQISPSYGPLRGGISVTIKGSNLGIHKDDIKSISVAGVRCIHQEEKYSVSTRWCSRCSVLNTSLLILGSGACRCLGSGLVFRNVAAHLKLVHLCGALCSSWSFTKLTFSPVCRLLSWTPWRWTQLLSLELKGKKSGRWKRLKDQAVFLALTCPISMSWDVLARSHTELLSSLTLLMSEGGRALCSLGC